MERHLRALLRDVMCGYLNADLRSVADGLLLSTSRSRSRSEALRRSGRSDLRGEGSGRAGRSLAPLSIEAEPVDAEAAIFDDDPASFSAPV